MYPDSNPDDRAISELIGMVLLIALVLLGSTTIIILGAGALNDAQEQTRTEAAGDHLQELDARLSTLAESDGLPRAEFDTSRSVAREYRIERDGYINVTVDKNASCSFQQPFSTVVHEDSQGRTVGYEAGGVWRAGLEGSTTLTPPDVIFEDGTLSIQLVNLTGTIDQSTNVARLNVTATQARSNRYRTALTQGDCLRPDNVTIWVKSRFQTGWRNYLSAETGVSDANITTFPNGTIRLYLRQSILHPSVNDETNNVVNLKEGRLGIDIPYMHDVELNDGKPVGVLVNKTAGNTYSGFVEPLTDKGLDIGTEVNIEGTNVTGPPLDVSLIMDESGSMGDPAPPYSSKTEAAIDAAKDFVGERNASRDRISIQGYNGEGTYHLVNEMHFSQDFSSVNSTLDNAIGNSGSTRIDRGLNYSNAVFDLKSNESRRKVTVLLTDGRNYNCNDADPTYSCDDNVLTLESAWRADNASVTIYTIGFGSDVRDELLKDVAQTTGGKYYPANDSDALAAAFANISKRISPQNAIASTPLTSNITTGSGLFDADIPGNTSHIARVTAGNHTYTNINDPTAPALFSHSFAIEDGEEAVFNLTKYDCAAYNLTGQTRTVNGSTLSVARCTNITTQNKTIDGNIRLDGERPETLLQTTYAPWQTDVNKSLDAFPTVNISASTGELEAQSNQALIVFDLPPEGSGPTRNTLAFLYQIGLSEAEARGERIVNVRVAEATVS